MLNRVVAILLIPAVPMFAMDTVRLSSCSCQDKKATQSVPAYKATSGDARDRARDMSRLCNCCGCCDGGAENPQQLTQETDEHHHHAPSNPAGDDEAPNTEDSSCTPVINVTAAKVIETSENPPRITNLGTGKNLLIIDTASIRPCAIELIDAPTRGPPIAL